MRWFVHNSLVRVSDYQSMNVCFVFVGVCVRVYFGNTPVYSTIPHFQHARAMSCHVCIMCYDSSLTYSSTSCFPVVLNRQIWNKLIISEWMCNFNQKSKQKKNTLNIRNELSEIKPSFHRSFFCIYVRVNVPKWNRLTKITTWKCSRYFYRFKQHEWNLRKRANHADNKITKVRRRFMTTTTKKKTHTEKQRKNKRTQAKKSDSNKYYLQTTKLMWIVMSI